MEWRTVAITDKKIAAGPRFKHEGKIFACRYRAEIAFDPAHAKMVDCCLARKFRLGGVIDKNRIAAGVIYFGGGAIAFGL